jgi:hypothetical protein
VRQGAEEGKAPEKDRSSLRNAAIASAVGASLAAVLAKKQAVGVGTAPEDAQWEKGTSRSEKTQWEKGTSGSEKTQWKKGESGSKATQWVSCGRFGVQGKAETYASMTALAKAIGRSSSQSALSRALKRAKEKTPSSALCVDFKYCGLELFWDKESGVGESAVAVEEEEEEAT